MKPLEMRESIAFFTTLDAICVLGLMDDGSYRIYRSGREIGVFDDLDAAAEEMYAYRDRLEMEAIAAGLFHREEDDFELRLQAQKEELVSY